MSELVLPDVSEWQGSVDWNAFVSAGNEAAIIRAYAGTRPDKYWPANRDNFHSAGGRILGIYSYITARDVVSQASAFCDLLGSLRTGEFAICDLEEGGGDQAARAAAWRTTVDSRLGGKSWIYSSQYFYRDKNLAAAGFGANRTWIAAYRPDRPTWPDHGMWQFTDRYGPMPGIKTPHDASKFFGSIDDLADLVGSAGPPTSHRTGKIPFPGADKFGPGKSNDYIRKLGELLIAKGYRNYYTVGAGPTWGPADQAATAAFQRAQGWTGSGADGIPGPETWSRLQD